MVYRLVRVYRVNSRKNKYEIAGLNGKIYKLNSSEIKSLIKNGDTIEGIKISKDNRVITDRRYTIMKMEKTIKKENTEEIRILDDECIIYTGKTLEEYIKSVNRYRHRDIVEEIKQELEKWQLGNIIVVYGIRRTGKTTAIYHVIQDIIDSGVESKEIAYIIMHKKANGMRELLNILNRMRQTYIFIDEVTNFTDFWREARTYSDSLANRKRIVFTGTDSYKFQLASYDILQGRMRYIHSIPSSYNEYRTVMGGNEEFYRQYGGVYLIDSIKNVRGLYSQIMIPIAHNIAHSIEEFRKFKYDIGLNGAQLEEINRLSTIELVYLVFNTLLHVTRTGTSKSFLLDRQKFNNIVEDIFMRYMSIYSVNSINNENIRKIPLHVYDEVLTILMEMGVVKPLPNLAVSKYVKIDSTVEYVCTIQGVTNAIAELIYKDDKTKGMSFENMILLQCIIWRNTIEKKGKIGVTVGYARYIHNGNSYEVDCIIEYGKYMYAIEIKSSNKPNSMHLKTLKNTGLEKALNHKIKGRYVVYSGKTQLFEGIQYINSGEFMGNIEKWIQD